MREKCSMPLGRELREQGQGEMHLNMLPGIGFDGFF
jgi:hypothetical protein